MAAPVITALPPAPSRSDAPDTFVAKADAHVAALTTWTTEANTLGTWINNTASDVDADATTASNAATTATNAATTATNAATSAINAPGTSATSTTSMSIGAGTLNFSVQTGKAFVLGQFVTVTNSANNWMYGNIVSYDSGTGAMVVNSTMTSGSGTFNSWTIALSAPITQPAPSAVVYSYTTFGGL